MGKVGIGLNLEAVQDFAQIVRMGQSSSPRNWATSISSRWSIGAGNCSAKPATSIAFRCSTTPCGFAARWKSTA